MFSCDFDKIVDRIKDQVDRITSRQVGQDALEDDIIEDIRSDIERAERVDTDLDLTDWLNRKWFPGVNDFLSSTLSVIKTILFPTEDGRICCKVKGVHQKKNEKKETQRN